MGGEALSEKAGRKVTDREILRKGSRAAITH
jgi:hypothetical protein